MQKRDLVVYGYDVLDGRDLRCRRSAQRVIGERHNDSGVNETVLLLELGAYDGSRLAPAMAEPDQLDAERLHEFCIRKNRLHVCH